MAKKRSKKDRLRAEMHRLAKVQSPQQTIQGVPSQFEKDSQKSPKEENYLDKIFAYDPKLILKDLGKTLIVVVLILLILLAIALLYT